MAVVPLISARPSLASNDDGLQPAIESASALGMRLPR